MIVIVVIKESGDQSGANVTALTSQMEQDVRGRIMHIAKPTHSLYIHIYIHILTAPILTQYTSGTLIIKYNNEALIPDGEYTTSEVSQEEDEDDTELETWHIIVIAVAGVAIILLILVSITVGSLSPFILSPSLPLFSIFMF